MQKLKGEINEKRHQIRVLEQRMIESVGKAPHTSNNAEMSQVSMLQVKCWLSQNFWVMLLNCED